MPSNVPNKDKRTSKIIAGKKYWLWDAYHAKKYAQQHANAVRKSFKGVRISRIPGSNLFEWGVFVR